MTAADAELRSVEAAAAQVLGAIPGPTEIETASLSQALGRVLAHDLVSTLDLPPWDNSAMDGYAIRSADTAEATPERPTLLRISGDLAAGTAPSDEVDRNTAIRIATGARLPARVDAVVPVELTIPAGANGQPVGAPSRDASGPPPNAILVSEPVPAGRSIRPPEQH